MMRSDSAWIDVKEGVVPPVGVPFVAAIRTRDGLGRYFLLYCFDGSEDYSCVDEDGYALDESFWLMENGDRVTHYLLLPPFDVGD